jgi:hypothetical protein
MLEHAALQQRSNETIVSYAKRIGVPDYKMQYWVSKYKDKQKKQIIDSRGSLEFIDLGSFSNQEQSVNAGSQTGTVETSVVSPLQDERLPQITLTFPNGMCLKIY